MYADGHSDIRIQSIDRKSKRLWEHYTTNYHYQFKFGGGANRIWNGIAQIRNRLLIDCQLVEYNQIKAKKERGE